jgi:hypothetical protein
LKDIAYDGLLILKDLRPDFFKEFKLPKGDYDYSKIIETNCKNLVIRALSFKLGINWNVVVPKHQNKDYKMKGGNPTDYPEDNESEDNYYAPSKETSRIYHADKSKRNAEVHNILITDEGAADQEGIPDSNAENERYEIKSRKNMEI